MEEHRFSFARGDLKVHEDKVIFGRWERGELTTPEAAAMLSENNDSICTVEEFPKIAASLGYRRAATYDTVQDRWRVNPDVEEMFRKLEEKAAIAEVMEGMAKA